MDTRRRLLSNFIRRSRPIDPFVSTRLSDLQLFGLALLAATVAVGYAIAAGMFPRRWYFVLILAIAAYSFLVFVGKYLYFGLERG